MRVTSSHNTIGGTAAGAGNLVSGNGASGMDIFGTDNQVQGNYVGTDVTGTAAIGNGEGIFITGSNNRIGGTAAGAGNVISGNSNGVDIERPRGGTLVQGNRIGTDATGTAAAGERRRRARGSVPDTTVGGTAAGAGNVISGNTVFTAPSSPSAGPRCKGNFIGTDVTGTIPLGNGAAACFSISPGNIGRRDGGRGRQHHRLQRRAGCRRCRA